MSETADYSPGDWKGHDFSSARKAYDVHVGRSYSDAKDSNKKAADLVPESISTDSDAPLMILCDVTGSMGSWPATIFSKLPYLDLEGKEYLGPNMEISFAAVGDAHSDRYPIQIRGFKAGTDLEKELKQLVIEGGGGGQSSESYELTALYYARNAKMPNAVRPIMIIIGDEGFYETITKDHAKLAHVSLENSRINTDELFKELQEKYSVYLIRKPYDNGGEDAIQRRWEKLIGKEHIAMLPSADRVVDVIFGILAQEKNRVDYFRKEIEDRQRDDQVNTVYKALKTIHAIPAKASDPIDIKKTAGKSVMHKSIKGNPTKRLLP
jgi:hypothetical protein